MQFNPQYTQIATGLADQKRKLPSPPEQYSQPGGPVQQTAAPTDPYAAIRRLPGSTFTWGEATPGGVDNSGYDPKTIDPVAAGWRGVAGFEGTPFQTKYGGGPIDLGGGRLGLTFQQPGAHKYDTMQGQYAIDPATNEWVLQNDPMENKTRQVSSGEEFRDNVELAGKGVLAAGALYGAGLGLSTGIEALGAGAGAGSGEVIAPLAQTGSPEFYATLAGAEPASTAALTTTGQFTLPELATVPVANGATGATNAALIESSLGTAGYGASSAGAGGGAGTGILGDLGNYASQAGQFLKQNPQLAQAGTAALLSQAGDKPGAAPTLGAGGSAGSPAASGNIQALTDALAARLSGTVNQANDFSGVPSLQTNAGDPKGYSQEAADAIYSQQTRYLDPQVKIQQQALEARLAEQGFVPGTPGYAQAMQVFQDTNARAYGAARDAATAQGVTAGRGYFADSLSNANLNNSASRETLAQMLAQRNQPFNELASLRTGNQIDAKQQYDADSDRYNASVAESNSKNQSNALLINGLLQYFSDARLKDDIQPAGQTPGGANLYTYSIFGRRERGVLAQELILTQPEAVSVDPETGFFLVNYAKVR